MKKWGFWLLMVFVVGNMVGLGIFFLLSLFVIIVSLFGVMFVWFLIGVGVLMIVFVFGYLFICKFELIVGL